LLPCFEVAALELAGRGAHPARRTSDFRTVTVQPIYLQPPAAQPRRCFGVIEGVRLHWLEYGRASGGRAPVVLLHGLNDSHLTWHRIAPALARDRRVLALDLPGHGISDRPDAGYELAWYAQIVGHWIDEALDFQAVDIVGHSLGGGIALGLLANQRPSIRRLVLAAPGGLGREIAFVLRLAAVPGVVEHFGQPFMSIGTWLALGGWLDKNPDPHIAELSAMNATSGSARAFARTVRDLIDWRGQRHSFLRYAHQIGEIPPMAVLWGDSDTIIPIAHGRALVDGVEGVRFTELTACGHHLHHDDPEGFIVGVRDALDALTWPRMRVRTPTPAQSGTISVFADPEDARAG
jgi:pimeloyl-ACP methyl ester carboxylesterase